MITRPYQILSTLYHMHVFYFQNANFDCYVFDKSRHAKGNPKGESIRSSRKQDRWLLSRLGLVIDQCTDCVLEGAVS